MSKAIDREIAEARKDMEREVVSWHLSNHSRRTVDERQEEMQPQNEKQHLPNLSPLPFRKLHENELVKEKTQASCHQARSHGTSFGE